MNIYLINFKQLLYMVKVQIILLLKIFFSLQKFKLCFKPFFLFILNLLHIPYLIIDLLIEIVYVLLHKNVKTNFFRYIINFSEA